MAASTEVASGYVSLYARMEGSQLANEVSKAVSNAFSDHALSGALSSFGKFATHAGTILTTALVGGAYAAKNVIGDVLETISNTEAADLALTTMFTPEFDGDRNAAAVFADEYIDRLNEFAIETPFGFESALAGARTLIAMGYEGTEVLDEAGDGVLRWSGDMAAALGGNAQTFNNIILQLGHMKSLGHVMSFQMNALARNGVPAWRALAMYMNEANVEVEGFEGYTGDWDVEKVREATREGAISSEVGISALEWYSTENYTDMMEQMSHTFSGIMMNMSDAVQTPIRTLYETDAYKNFTDKLYNMLTPLRGIVTALLPTFELLFDKMAKSVEWLTGKIEKFTEKLNNGEITSEQILHVFEALGGVLSLGPLFLAMGGLSTSFADVAKKAETFTSSFKKGLKSSLDDLGLFNKEVKKTSKAMAAPAAKKPWALDMSSDGLTKKDIDHLIDDEIERINQRRGINPLSGAEKNVDASTKIMRGKFRSFLRDIDNMAAANSVAMGKHFSVPPKIGLFDVIRASGKTTAVDIKNVATNIKTSVLGIINRFTHMGTTVSVECSKSVAALRMMGSALSTVTTQALAATAAVTKFGMAAFAAFAKATLGVAAIVGVIALVGTAAAGAFVAMGGNLASLGNEIKLTLTDTGTMVAGIMTSMTTALKTISEEGQVQSFFMSLRQGINSFMSQIGEVAPEFIAAFTDVFQQVVTGVLGLLFSYGPSVLEGAIELFTGLINGLSYIVGEMAPEIPLFIAEIVHMLTEHAPEFISGCVDLFSNLVDAFAGAVDGLMSELPSFIQTISSSISDNMPKILEAAQTLFLAFLESIPIVLPLIIEGIATMISGLADAINDDDGSFLDKAVELFGKIGEAIGKSLPKLLEALGKLLLSLVKKIPEFIPKFFEGGLNLIGGLLDGLFGGKPEVEEAGKDSADAFTSGLSSKEFDVGDAMKDLADMAAECAREKIPDIHEVGADISEGLAEGISENTTVVKSGMSESVAAVIDTAKDGFEIHSPSKVFEDIGKNVIDGLNEGISNTDSKTDIENVADGIIKTFNGSAQWLTSAGSNIVKGLSSGIDNSNGLAVNSSDYVKDMVSFVFSDSDSLLYSSGTDTTSGFASGIRNPMYMLVDAANQIASMVVGSVDVGSLFQTGINFVAGFVSGISNSLWMVWDTVSGMASSAVGLVNSIFQIGSPSRVMMRTGGYFAEGFAIGVEDEIGSVEQSVTRMADAATDAVVSEFAPSSFGMQNGFGMYGSSMYNVPSAAQIANAIASQMNGMGVYLSADETSAQLAPSMDRALGRLAYMGV